jgi:hypothetical protein
LNDFDPSIRVEDFECEEDFVRFVNVNVTYMNPLDIVCDVRVCSLEDISRKYLVLTQENNLLRLLISVYDEWFLLNHLDENDNDLSKAKEYYDEFYLLNNVRLWLSEVQGNIGVCLLYVE